MDKLLYPNKYLVISESYISVHEIFSNFLLCFRYSEDVKDAGILFASIVNFSELYDESFMEGRECLRVLNELVI